MFEGHGLTALQFAALEMMLNNRGVAHHAICTGIDAAPSVLTTALKPLLARNLARGERSPADRRAIGYALTPEGEAWFLEIRAGIFEADRRLLASLTPTERAHLLSALKKIGTRRE